MHAVRLFTIFFIMLLSYMYRSVTDWALILSLKVSSIHDMLKTHGQKKVLVEKVEGLTSLGHGSRPAERTATDIKWGTIRCDNAGPKILRNSYCILSTVFSPSLRLLSPPLFPPLPFPPVLPPLSFLRSIPP